MNERIKELAEQAAKNYTETFKWEYLPDIDRNIFKKFAELIVKECISYIDSRDYHSGSEGIAEHFGVEE